MERSKFKQREYSTPVQPVALWLLLAASVPSCSQAEPCPAATQQVSEHTAVQLQAVPLQVALMPSSFQELSWLLPALWLPAVSLARRGFIRASVQKYTQDQRLGRE